MSTFKNRWSKFLFFESSKLVFGLGFACLFLSAGLGGLLPRFIQRLSQNYNNPEIYNQSIVWLGILFVLIYLNNSFFQLLAHYFLKQFMRKLRASLYNSWLNCYELSCEGRDVEDKYPQGEVIARIISDTETVRELVTSGTFRILMDIFFVLSCLVSFILLESSTGIVLAFFEVVAAFLLVWGSRYMRQVFIRVSKSRGEVLKTVGNLVGGVSQTYYTPHYNYARNKGKDSFDNFLKTQLVANVWDASYFSIAESLYPILLALLVFILPHSKVTDAALIFVIVDLIQRSIGPIKDIAGKIANIQRSRAGINRIDEFMDDLESGYQSSEREKNKKINFESMVVNIPFFTFPLRSTGDTPFTLENIKFEGRAGDLIGVAGMSGSGKSTLLNILVGNIVPKSGHIKLIFSDSEVQLDMNVLEFKEYVGIVSQESHIFTESLLFNITFQSEKNANVESFWKWIKEKIPYVNDWGLSLGDKIEPNDISQGQKQLIAAIRSCYLKKPVVLFDEISSALDSRLEKALSEVIQIIQEHSLTIVVAHRLETIMGASKILVMKNGGIFCEGSHDQLLKTSTHYQGFVKELSHS